MFCGRQGFERWGAWVTKVSLQSRFLSVYHRLVRGYSRLRVCISGSGPEGGDHFGVFFLRVLRDVGG